MELEQFMLVSIQLVSPASGDDQVGLNKEYFHLCFHSISFPSEWGLRSKNDGDRISS